MSLHYLVKYNTATTIYFPMVKRGVVDLAVTADWTPAVGDCNISKDGGAQANPAGTIAISAGTTWKLALSGTELSAAEVQVMIVDSATKAVEDQWLTLRTYGNASAYYINDPTLANLPANVTQILGTAVSTPATAGILDVNVKNMNNVAGTAITTIKAVQGLAVDGVVTTVTNQLTAAQVATGIWQDTTGTDFTTASSIGKSLYTTGNAPGAASGLALVGSNVGVATSVSGAVGSVTGSVGSVTGAVGSVTGAVGSVTGAVGSVTAGVTLANGAHGGAAATMQLGGAGGLTSTVTGNVTGSVGSVTGAVGSVTGAVGSVTGSVGSVTGAVGSVTGNVGGNVVGSVASVTAAVALTAGERTSVADALLDRDMSTGADNGSTTVRTVRQALRFLRNKWSITAGTLVVYKEDDAATSWTGAVSTTAGNPVSTVDPA